MKKHVEKVFAQNWIEQLKDVNDEHPYFTDTPIYGLRETMRSYDTGFLRACINIGHFNFRWAKREIDIRRGLGLTR